MTKHRIISARGRREPLSFGLPLLVGEGALETLLLARLRLDLLPLPQQRILVLGQAAARFIQLTLLLGQCRHVQVAGLQVLLKLLHMRLPLLQLLRQIADAALQHLDLLRPGQQFLLRGLAGLL